MEVSSPLHAPADLPPRKNPEYSLGGPQGQSGRFVEEDNFLSLAGYESQALQPVA